MRNDFYRGITCAGPLLALHFVPHSFSAARRYPSWREEEARLTDAASAGPGRNWRPAMDEASEELKFAHTRLELDHQLARLGLKGPLWAAWAKLLAIAA